METKRNLLDEVSLETFTRDNNLRISVTEFAEGVNLPAKTAKFYFLACFEFKDDRLYFSLDNNSGRGETEEEAIKDLIVHTSGQYLKMEMKAPKLKLQGD